MGLGGFALVLTVLRFVSGAASAGEREILHLYTWSEFFAPEVVADFEEKYGCIVAIDLFDSNEAMLESIVAGNAPYDIVTPSSYMVEEMRRRGLVAPIRHALIPNLKWLDAAFLEFTEDPEMKYSVPYTRTVTGVGYRVDRLGELAPEERGWALFSRPELKGRATMLDDMRETLGAALKTLGYSLNSTDATQIGEAGTLLGKWRDNLARFEIDEANIGLGGGEFTAVHGYNGDLAVLMEENDQIGFFVPEEGSAVTTDHFAILEGSGNVRLAHAFINHFLEPSAAAANMAEIFYYMPVPAAVELLEPRIRNSPAFSVPDEIMAKCEVIRDVGEDIAIYEKVWTQVRR